MAMDDDTESSPHTTHVDSPEEEDIQNTDEYTALNRYISTYRGSGQAAAGHEDAESNPKRVWYAPWKTSKSIHGTTSTSKDGKEEPFKPPKEWLETDISRGLHGGEVEERRKHTGFNELVSEHENMWLKFVSYFMGPIQYVMELAVLLAAGLREWIDFGVIIGILLLNATVGWYQEKQAADIVSSLKADISMKARVIRDGKEDTILARELVVGDIVIIEEGQIVPADSIIICDYDDKSGFQRFRELRLREEAGESHPEDKAKEGEKEDDDDDEDGHHDGPSLVALDQSAITGESLAVDKYMGEVCYYTTGCKRGKAFAVVHTQAKTSFVGRTASMVQGAKDQGHFKAIMNSIGTALLVIVMAWILIAWIGGFFHNLDIATPQNSSQNMLHYTLILLVIGVPVGLPVVTTTTMAVGAAYLAKQRAIVQKLTAIESLAGVDVLCSDKTGTLTANQLSIREPYVAEGQDVNWLMAVSALASSHKIKSLDPIDKVTILTLKRYPKAREILSQGWKTEKFVPFDPVSKRITTTVMCKGERYICAKGAPKAILSLAETAKDVADHYRNKATEFARRGFRSLGVAVQKEGEGWVVLGMLPMFDPPREDTAQTITEAQNLGISVKMVTGDAIAIAKETCKMLNLGTNVYNSEKLVHGGLNGTTQHDFVEKADGFAEVFPEHKYQVVEMLQQRGHLTAMTGDGVNDAPSLKKADCGIAVEGASEAAQSAADIVFLAPGLGTIVDSIKVARQIFHRMKAYIQYRIALCLHLEIYLVTSMCIINETIGVKLIVFLALFADLATIAVAYDNAPHAKRPVEWQLPKIWIISVVLGILLAIGTWIIRGTLFLPNGGIIQEWGGVQEILFLEVSLTENWLIFVTRGGTTLPSWQLVIAILGVDAISTLFCAFGWLNEHEVSTPRDHATFTQNGAVDIITIVCIWAYSLGVIIVISMVYFLLNKMTWLDNLGRKTRSRADEKIENIFGQLAKVAIEHERSENGHDLYTFVSKSTQAESDD